MNANATAMHAKQGFMIKYHAQAKRYLLDHGRYETASQDEFERLAESFRYHDFRRAIEPVERQRNKAVSDWLSLQAMPAEQPDWLKKIVADWNEHIAFIGRSEFGYEPTSEVTK